MNFYWRRFMYHLVPPGDVWLTVAIWTAIAALAYNAAGLPGVGVTVGLYLLLAVLRFTISDEWWDRYFRAED